MNVLQNDLIKVTNNIPYYYLQDLLDYAKYLKQKAEKENDTDYLEKMPGIVESIIQASKEELADCSRKLDW